MASFGEPAEHAEGIVAVAGFTKDVTLQDDHSVGRDEQLVGRERRRIGTCLGVGDVQRNVLRPECLGVRFINVGDHAHVELHAQPAEQFASAWRLGCQDDAVPRGQYDRRPCWFCMPPAWSGARSLSRLILRESFL